MNIRLLTPENLHDVAKEAADVLSGDGVILYPTDTLYGLGADATNDAALEKLYAIKARDPQKPVHYIINEFSIAQNFAHITPLAELLAKTFFPGPLTLILPRKITAIEFSKSPLHEIGFRVPKSDFCLAVAAILKRPFTATSANLSGMLTENSVEKILAQLGEKAELIDLVIDAGTLSPSLPSTVVDVSSDIPHVLREGAIPAERIMSVLE